MTKLTQKQENFVLKYFEGSTATEAYRQSYSTKGMRDKTVWEKASRLMKKEKIVSRLHEMRKEAEKSSAWNRERWLKEQEDVLIAAMGKKQTKHLVQEGADGIMKNVEIDSADTNLAAANTALNHIGKALGVFEKDNEQKNDANSLAEFIKRIAK